MISFQVGWLCAGLGALAALGLATLDAAFVATFFVVVLCVLGRAFVDLADTGAGAGDGDLEVFEDMV